MTTGRKNQARAEPFVTAVIGIFIRARADFHIERVTGDEGVEGGPTIRQGIEKERAWIRMAYREIQSP
jgi:hypothetical protein